MGFEQSFPLWVSRRMCLSPYPCCSWNPAQWPLFYLYLHTFLTNHRTIPLRWNECRFCTHIPCTCCHSGQREEITCECSVGIWLSGLKLLPPGDTRWKQIFRPLYSMLCLTLLLFPVHPECRRSCLQRKVMSSCSICLRLALHVFQFHRHPRWPAWDISH